MVRRYSISYVHDALATPLPTSQFPVVFFHEPKTSGSTLRRCLYHAASRNGLEYFIPCYIPKFPLGCMLTMWQEDLDTAAKDRPKLWRLWAEAAIIGGCYNWDVTPLLLRTRRVGFRCLRMAREPVSRLISWFYEYVYERPMDKGGTPKRLSQLKPDEAVRLFARRGEYLKEGPATNSTLRMLCGRRPCDLATAMHRLRSNCLIGLTERHQETCELFNARMPWLQMNCSFAMHVGEPHEKRHDLSPELLAALEFIAGPYEKPLWKEAEQLFEHYRNGRPWPFALARARGANRTEGGADEEEEAAGDEDDVEDAT